MAKRVIAGKSNGSILSISLSHLCHHKIILLDIFPTTILSLQRWQTYFCSISSRIIIWIKGRECTFSHQIIPISFWRSPFQGISPFRDRIIIYEHTDFITFCKNSTPHFSRITGSRLIMYNPYLSYNRHW